MKDLEGNFKYKKKWVVERRKTVAVQVGVYCSREQLGTISDDMATHHRPLGRKTKNS